MYGLYKKHETLLSAVFFVIPYFLLFYCWDGLYRDTDNYTHARRMLDFLESGVWAEQPFMHSNFPNGEILNFTRIMDLFWLIFSVPFLPFLPVKDAVYFGGVLMQPCAAVFTAWALIRALKPYFGVTARLTAMLFFFFLPAVIQIYMFARPDHHTGIVLFGWLTAGCFLKYCRQRDFSQIRLAGICGGILLWLSVEGILFSYFLAAGLTVLWVFGKEELKPAKIFMLYVFIGSFVFWLANPPYEGMFFADNGRLSVLPVTALGFSALALFAADSKIVRPAEKNALGRILCLFFLAVVFGSLLLIVFGGPRVVFAPYFPPEIKGIWSADSGEFRPAYSSALLFATCAAPSLAALIFGLCAFKNASADERKALIVTGIPLFFFFLLTLKNIRFAENAAVFTVFPVILFWRNFLKEDMPENPKTAGIILAALYFFGMLYLSFCMLQIQENSAYRSRTVFGFGRIVPFLSDAGGTVLTQDFLGPEVIWTTGRPVIGTPDHRNIEGIVDTHALLYGKNHEEVVRLLKKHAVTDILLAADMHVSQTGALFGLGCIKKIDGTPKDLILYHVVPSECY